MKTPTEQQLNSFVKSSKKQPKVFAGFVYIGNGSFNDPVGAYFPKREIYCLNSIEGLSNQLSQGSYFEGSGFDDDLYVKNEIFQKYVLDKLKPKTAKKAAPRKRVAKVDYGTLKEQVAYARNFLGKTVKNRYNPNKVADVRSVKIADDISSYYLSKDEQSQGYIMLEDQGFVIVLHCKDSNGYDATVIAHEQVLPVELGEKPVRVNGYTAIKHADYVNFGCANIDNEYLKLTGEYLEKIQKVKKVGNRDVKVLIGNATFNLDIIKALNL